MNRTAVRFSAGWMKTAGLIALALAIGPMTAGCRSGGITIGTGISTTDDHGDSSLDATLVLADGKGTKGQINFPGDVDWFKFHGIQSVGYALQIHGFPTDPTVDPKLDLNGNGNDVLEAQIVDIDGVTQLVNSSGTQGGQPGDVAPAGGSPTTGFNTVGDSRFFWICPSTGDFFVRIAHRRNGIGAYRFRIASSQPTRFGLGQIGAFQNTFFQTGQRVVHLRATNGDPIFDGNIAGAIWWPGIEFVDSIGSVIIFDIQGQISQLIIPPGSTTPLVPHFHAHRGRPNVFFPEASDNTTRPPGVHPTFLDIAATVPTGRATSTAQSISTEGTITLSDGTRARFPVTEELTIPTDGPLKGGVGFRLALHLDEAVSETPRANVTVSAAELRTITGFDWYFDLHPQPDMTLDPAPIAVSRPLADTYNMFESQLDAQSGNVVLRDGSRLPANRGTTGFNIFYDSSLKLFQVATQIYEVDGTGAAGVVQPDYSAFVGDRVKVHKGGVGTTGPVIIDLGNLPPVREPRSASPPFSRNTIFEPEGFKQAIRQLTEAETEILRDAFYNGGFYVEVTDQFSGAPLVRAEGSLDISFFPSRNPCDAPPCSGVEAANGVPDKGVVTFALGTAGLGAVELYANGELLGTLSQPVSPDRLPVCGLEGDGTTLATELWPDTYYWHAHTKDGKMVDGHVTVVGGQCQMVLVK